MKLKRAKDYNKEDSSPVDQFILDEIQPKLEDSRGYAMIYMNVLHLESVSFTALKKRLKELGFKVTQGKEGVDDVVYIEA